MARSRKNRRRAMSRSEASKGWSPGGSLRGDWVISSQGVNAAGTPITQNGYGGASGAITAGTPLTLLCVALPTAAAATGQPTIGEVEIDMIHAYLPFFGGSAAGVYGWAIGLYVAELNSSATAWSVRDPSTPADANRDDYLWLDQVSYTTPTSANAVAQSEISRRPVLPFPIRIGGGQALALTVALLAGSSGTSSFDFWVRTHVRRAS